MSARPCSAACAVFFRASCVDGPSGARGKFVLTGREGCIHVSGPLLRPLALMNSADRRPNHLTALGGAWSPWVWPIPGPAGSSSRLTTLAHPPRRAIRRRRGECGLRRARRRVGHSPRHHHPNDARGLVGQRRSGQLCRLALQRLRRPTTAGALRASRITAVAPTTSGRRR